MRSIPGYDREAEGQCKVRMRKASSGFEEIVFLGGALFLLLSTGVAALLRSRLHLQNTRVQYGMEHLPAALLAAFLFTLFVWLANRILPQWDNLAGLPSIYYVSVMTAVFCFFWLPPALAGSFGADDWMLLTAAAVRKVIYLHPGLSWNTLDAVDGNFRPLGTVLYFGYMFRAFGLSPLPYLLGLFFINLLGSMLPFFLVREMGYSRVAGATASLLFMSRSLTYTIETWPSALGDALVILLCGLMALALLRATRSTGWTALGFHLLAWVSFCLATLSKQSSFAAPLIVALLLFFRPGQTKATSWLRRASTSLLGMTIYTAIAAIVYFHAKSLSQAQSPYPIGFSWDALLRTFSYPAWYFTTLEFPSKMVLLNRIPSLTGAGIVAAVLVLIWRVPRLLGERPSDVVFCLLAATASISLFVVLATRTAAYYSSLAAFWMSLALGIMLTRFGAPKHGSLHARIACFVFCMLLVTGFADVRLKQTGLLPSGGYTWGTYTGAFDTAIYTQMRDALAAAPQVEVLVLADMPGIQSHFACMALLADPKLNSILAYDSRTRTYLANDRYGTRPQDTFSALTDAKAYNWTVPLEAEDASSLAARNGVLWLKFYEGKVIAGN